MKQAFNLLQTFIWMHIVPPVWHKGPDRVRRNQVIGIWVWSYINITGSQLTVGWMKTGRSNITVNKFLGSFLMWLIYVTHDIHEFGNVDWSRVTRFLKLRHCLGIPEARNMQQPLSLSLPCVSEVRTTRPHMLSALGFPRHATCSNHYPIPEPTLSPRYTQPDPHVRLPGVSHGTLLHLCCRRLLFVDLLGKSAELHTTACCLGPPLTPQPPCTRHNVAVAAQTDNAVWACSLPWQLCFPHPLHCNVSKAKKCLSTIYIMCLYRFHLYSFNRSLSMPTCTCESYACNGKDC